MNKAVKDTSSHSLTEFCCCLGDVGKKHHFMSCRELGGIDEIANLADKDFAFVKRSNGEWQLSIVVETSTTDVLDDMYIKFLLDDKGHTKTIPFHQWTKLIRLVKRPQSVCTQASPQDPIDQCKMQTYKRSVSWAGFSEEDINAAKPLLEATLPIRYDLKDQRRVSLEGHQRAFLSALASIDQGVAANKYSRSIARRFV